MFSVMIQNPPGLHEQALEFALDNGLPSVYDALYVVPARMLGAECWTADQRLLRAALGVVPWVRDLGRYT